MSENKSFEFSLKTIILLNLFITSTQNDMISRNCNQLSPEYSSTDCDPSLITNALKTTQDMDSLNLKKKSKVSNKSNNRSDKNRFDLSDHNMDTQYRKLSDFYSKINLNLKPIELRLKQTMFEFIISLNISKECIGSLISINKSLKQNEFWPLNFIDSMGKVPSGLLSGVLTSFGEYEQCLAIKSPHRNDSYEIYGRYCLVRPYLPYPNFKELESIQKLDFLSDQMNEFLLSKAKDKLNLIKLLITYNLEADNLYLFNLGLCIPSKCSANDLQNALNKVFYQMVGIPIEIGPKCDAITDSIDLNQYQWVLLVISSLFIGLVLTSTITQLINNLLFRSKKKFPIKNKKSLIEFMESFSVIEANKQLFSPFSDRLRIVDGLMLIYIIWNVMSNHYGNIITQGFVGYKGIQNSFLIHMIEETKYFWLRCMFPRDSIFLLSGIIISFDFFGAKKRPTNIWNYFRFVAEKYYRFLPKMIGPLLLLNILSIIGSGPKWHTAHHFFRTNCQNYYWKNILFINNLEGHSHSICNFASWYLSAIFQLQILAPVFMAPFRHSAKLGYALNLVFLPFACFATIAPKLIYGHKLLPFEVSELYLIDEMKYNLLRFFIFTDQYLSLFIIGVIVGYFLRNKQIFDRLVRKNAIRILIGLLCYSISVSGIAWSENFKDMNQKPNKLNLNTWFVFGKILWAVGNVWLIYDVYSRKDCFINKMLSTKIFAALTRLSIGILVTLTMVINFHNYSRRETIAISHINQMKLLYVDLSLLILSSYVLYIFIEHPFIKCLDLLRNNNRGDKLKNISNCQHNSKNNNNRIDSKPEDIELNYVFNE